MAKYTVHRPCPEMFYCFHRKSKKHKDKKRKATDEDEKPDIVGMCILIFTV